MSNNNYFWSKDQEELLRRAYEQGGLSAAEKLIPGKSRGTIATKASRLGITTPKPRKNPLGK